MSETITIYPSAVKQPNRNERNPISKWCFKEVRRQGESYNLGCAHPNDPRYFHEWSNAEELLQGRGIQCGRPSNKFCSHKTYYGIAGYRNTCPIAGCNGTYNQPATLQLELGKGHLSNYNVVDGSEIHSITLNFRHMSLGVDVSNGRTSKNWGPNFCGHNQYPDLKVINMYITDKNGEKKGNTVVHNKNPPLGTYEGVSATFTGITYNDIVDGHINIVYQRNLSTNPGNIYIQDLNISIDYTNASPYLSGKAQTKELYLSDTESCRTSVSHIIEVGYKNKDTKLPLSKSPKDLRNKIIVNVPDDVTYTKTNLNDREVEYKITDNSNTPGEKIVSYTVIDDNIASKIRFNESIRHISDGVFLEQITLNYIAKNRNKPNISTPLVFKQNGAMSNTKPSIIVSGEDLCIKNLKVYLDGIDTNPIYVFTSFNFDNKENVIKPDDISNFHNIIAQLPCGPHTLFFQIDDEDITTMQYIKINIIPIQYKFKVYVQPSDKKTYEGGDCPSDIIETDTDLSYIEYSQCKQDEIRILSIQRIDNEETIIEPTFKINTDTNYQNKTENSQSTINKGLQTVNQVPFAINQIKTFDISIKYPGDYTFSIEQDNNFTCNNKPIDKRIIHINPNHPQHHDVLFVRGEDSTSFDYDYIVAWEGDNIEEPIYLSEIDIGSTFDDIELCVEKEEFFTGLSEIGIAKIRVTNKSQKTLNDIKIELNVLKDDNGEKVATLEEFFDSDGIFNSLGDNFLSYNKNNIDNIDILNLPNTYDGDDIDEENVQILIRTLEYDEDSHTGDSIEINIPYISKTSKSIYIQPLIFEESIPIYKYYDCTTKSKPLDFFTLTVYDSILTDLIIEGDNDILDINKEHKDCPNECFTPIIHYKIRNIDSSQTEKISAKTLITNDANLIPYKIGYYEKNKLTQENVLVEKNVSEITNTDKAVWNHDIVVKKEILSHAIVKGFVKFPNYDEHIIVGRTDNKGEVTFNIDIPSNISKKYTITDLLKNVVRFEYTGDTEHQDSQLYINNDDVVINTMDTDDRNQVIFNYRTNYKRYKAGDVATITLSLVFMQKYLENTITFYPNIQEAGQSDELIVYYEVCNLKETSIKSYNNSEDIYNQGILKTTFETDDYQLVENKISKDIYLGLDTDLNSLVNIEKRFVEENELNIINIRLVNKVKDNKEVRCLIDLGPYPEQLIGEYDFVNVTKIDDGDYHIYFEDNVAMIEWLVGDMNKDSENNIQIILKGKEVGLSEIYVTLYDYLHPAKPDVNYYNQHNFGKRNCPEC